MARKGREGAEQITDIIGQVFEPLLAIAYEDGGSLLKFGGDALLLWFDGERHAAHACRATVLMRDALRRIGTIVLPETTITLQIAQGVHSGRFNFFAVGESHVELLATGPSWSRLVMVQNIAGADQIVVSTEASTALPAEILGESRGQGFLLEREPPGAFERLPLRPRPAMTAEAISRCLPRAVREHLRTAGALPEHRPVTVAFIRFGGTDALIELKGGRGAADALHQLVTIVEHAAEAQDVSFLGSDVDVDGGKLILTAGAPTVTGDDEERMLLALRAIVDSKLPLPIHIGVNRGAVLRRRHRACLPPHVHGHGRRREPRGAPDGAGGARGAGTIYATGEVLDRSKTTFETTELEPFTVKGKAEPIQRLVGRARPGLADARMREEQRLPLTGRNAELGVIRKAFASARGGEGRLVEVVG